MLSSFSNYLRMNPGPGIEVLGEDQHSILRLIYTKSIKNTFICLNLRPQFSYTVITIGGNHTGKITLSYTFSKAFNPPLSFSPSTDRLRITMNVWFRTYASRKVGFTIEIAEPTSFGVTRDTVVLGAPLICPQQHHY